MDWDLTTGAKGGEGARGSQAVRLMPGTPENSPSSQSNAGSGGRIARLRAESWPRLHKQAACFLGVQVWVGRRYRQHLPALEGVPRGCHSVRQETPCPSHRPTIQLDGKKEIE